MNPRHFCPKQAAGIGAVFALLLALPIGVLAARHTDRVTKGVESAAFISHALPGVVVGLSLVYLGLAVAPVLYQTLAMLGFAYASGRTHLRSVANTSRDARSPDSRAPSIYLPTRWRSRSRPRAPTCAACA